MELLPYSSQTVQASGGVHDLPEVAAQPAPAHHGLLRAPLPGQDVRRGQHPGRAQRVLEGGEGICISLAFFWVVGEKKWI